MDHSTIANLGRSGKCSLSDSRMFCCCPPVAKVVLEGDSLDGQRQSFDGDSFRIKIPPHFDQPSASAITQVPATTYSRPLTVVAMKYCALPVGMFLSASTKQSQKLHF
jgi:hypothetical protein